MKNIIVFICLFLFKNSYSQRVDNIKLSANVVYSDSEYLLVPKLEVSDNNREMYIPKHISYGNEIDLVDCNIYMQRLIGKSYLNIYLAGFHDKMFNDSSNKLMHFTPGSTLLDTINLKGLIPLEIGEYRVMLVLKYFDRGREMTCDSKWHEFSVFIKPRNSIF